MQEDKGPKMLYKETIHYKAHGLQEGMKICIMEGISDHSENKSMIHNSYSAGAE